MDPCCKRQLRTTMTNTWGANHGRRKRFLVTVGGGIHEKARVVADENWCFYLFFNGFHRSGGDNWELAASRSTG